MNNQVPATQTDNVSHIHATSPHMVQIQATSPQMVQIQATGPQMVQIPATNVPMMLIQSPTAIKTRFSARSKLFKVAMGCLLLCALVFTVGFSAPAWLNIMGLWMSCLYGVCVTVSMNGPDVDWFNAVRAMECLALIAFVTCLAVEVYQDFRKVVPVPAENKAVELLAFLAGMFGLIGVTIFGAESETGRLGIGYRLYMEIYLDWGFGLVAGACSLTIICAACIAYSRVKHAAQTNAALASQGYVTQQPLMFQHPGVAVGGATLGVYTQPPTAGYYYVAGNPNAQPYPVSAMAL